MRMRVSVSLALLTAAVAAGAEAPTRLGLAEALARAERDNPELAAVREQAQAEVARGRVASRATWPRLGVSGTWARTNVPAQVFMAKLNRGALAPSDFDPARLNDPDALGHLSAQATLEVPLDVFGTGAARGRAARAGGRAAELLVEEARQDLRLAVSEAYLSAVLARGAVRVVERALAGARAREAEIRARVDEGAALISDLLRARARRRQREAELAERQGQERVAAAGLRRLMGAASDQIFELTDAAATPGAVTHDLEAARERGLARRAGLKAAHERVAAAEAQQVGERRSLWPELSAFALVADDRGRLSDGRTSLGAGLGLRWSVFDPTFSARQAAAAADRRAAQVAERAAREQVHLDAQVALERARASRERFRAAQGGAEEGREALRVMQERRAAGLATLTDELETEAAGLGAELEELKAATDAALADAALARAMGEL